MKIDITAFHWSISACSLQWTCLRPASKQEDIKYKIRSESISTFPQVQGENIPYQAVFFSFDAQAKADQFFFYGVQRKVNSSGYQGIVESVQEFFTY